VAQNLNHFVKPDYQKIGKSADSTVVFSPKLDICPLHFDIEPGWCLSRARPAIMERFGSGEIHPLPTSPVKTVGPLDILAVDKEPLVQQPYLVQRFTPYHQEPAIQHVYLGVVIILEVGHHGPAEGL
jgi:hypothetical protein